MENNSEMNVAVVKESKTHKALSYLPALETVGRKVGKVALWGFATLGAVTAIGLVSSACKSDEDETEEV